jgi:hypothetical protein
LTEVEDKKEYFDKDLAGVIKEVLTKAVDQFSKIKSPVVNVDLKPIENLVKQNASILELITILSNGGNDEKYNDLFNRVIVMINSSNEFMKVGLKQFDYTDQIKQLIESNKRPVVDYITVEKDNSGIRKIIPFYKK